MALFFFISQEQEDLSNISQETRLQNSNLHSGRGRSRNPSCFRRLASAH